MTQYKTDSIHLSVVSPVYMAENIVAELVRQVKTAVADITDNFEIILVNDASPDRSWDKIVAECAADQRVKGINLSRNFGQHYAITAGLNHSKGDWVVVMDCDLQDRPDEIPNLYRKAQEGWDIVLARRINRQDSFLKKTYSKIFYKIYNYLTDTNIDPLTANFSIISKKVNSALHLIAEQHRSYLLFIHWAGFKRTTFDVMHQERLEGKSSYGFTRALKLAVNSMLVFSDKPLKITLKTGIILTMVAMAFILFKVILFILHGSPVIGWASIISVIIFSTGLIVTTIGVIGLYIGKVFNEVKKRPLYLTKETINI